MKRKIYAAIMLLAMVLNTFPLWASSHREAPMIADDPEALIIGRFFFTGSKAFLGNAFLY